MFCTSIIAGADVNARDGLGQTALMEAACRVNKEIIKALLRAGADVNARNKNGETALIKARKWTALFQYEGAETTIAVLERAENTLRQRARVAVAVAFLRANMESDFRFSFLPLVPGILQFVDGKKSSQFPFCSKKESREKF